jgi:hypothetical protein
MLVEESIWIAEKIKEILPEEPFPVLNIGSSTLSIEQKNSHLYKIIFLIFFQTKKTSYPSRHERR